MKYIYELLTYLQENVRSEVHYLFPQLIAYDYPVLLTGMSFPTQIQEPPQLQE